MESDPVAAGGSDRIELRGLEVVGVCGALPEERTRAQPLAFDLDVDVDLSVAGATDDLGDTVDYGAVCDVVARVVAEGAPKLLEHLAERVAEAVLALDERVSAVTISLCKLRPPVPHGLVTSGVRIRRTR